MNEKEEKIVFRFQFCPWKSLDTLRNMYFLRISYAILVIVPIIANINTRSIGAFFNELPWTMRLGYFSSLILSVAHMVYQGFCPQIIKRFESPNDLYRDLLEIKSLQNQFLSEDSGFTFDIDHCRNGFKVANFSTPWARLCSWMLFFIGMIFVGIIAVERSLIVLGFSESLAGWWNSVKLWWDTVNIVV